MFIEVGGYFKEIRDSKNKRRTLKAVLNDELMSDECECGRPSHLCSFADTEQHGDVDTEHRIEIDF